MIGQNISHYHIVEELGGGGMGVVLQTVSGRSYPSSYRIAEICLSLGDKDQAFGGLEKACEERARMLVMLKVEPEWIADLLCHGLLLSSFVPSKPIRELRDLTRYRRKLVEGQAGERNRLLKLLESANIKLASGATDVFGLSGRLMLRALIEAKTMPQEMAEMAKKKLRSKIPPAGAGLGREGRRTPPFSFEITTGSTRESRKRYSVSRATTPREAQALCRLTGPIGRDPWRGLDFGCSHHCRTGR